MITEKQRKALEILRRFPEGIKARHFAELMWPDSIMHETISNQGHGACRGKAAWLCGGSYLGKLCNAGFVTWHTRDIETGAYYLTIAGVNALEKAEVG